MLEPEQRVSFPSTAITVMYSAAFKAGHYPLIFNIRDVQKSSSLVNQKGQTEVNKMKGPFTLHLLMSVAPTWCCMLRINTRRGQLLP